MSQPIDLTASLVLYKNEPEMIVRVIKSLLDTPLNSRLYVVDNSPTPELSAVITKFENTDYYYADCNLGFGKAHNFAMSKVEKSKYHLILNPDISFGEEVIPKLVDYLEENKEVGLIQPKVLFPDGATQYLCKRYPTFLVFFVRRFIPKNLHFLIKKNLDWYEMRDTGYDKIIDVPFLSGCFMLLRREALEKIGYFDENIFMYCEDIDLTIRMAKCYRAVFYPYVSIFHYWEGGARKSLKLTLIFIQSAIYFFNKHGWKFI